MVFGSKEWVAALVAALNAQPDLSRALAGLGRDAALIVEAHGPAWPRTIAVYGHHEHGRIASWRFLADEDEVLELEPAYVVRAPYRIVKELFRGADPVQAALSGRVKVDGDLEAIVRRSSYRYVVDAALAVIATAFPDEEGVDA
jgi:hypothetical protein